MMRQTITIKDMRHAIMYVNNERVNRATNLQDISDEQLLDYELSRDLKMDNIKLTNVIIELQKALNLHLPLEIFKVVPDDRVKSLLETINQYIEGETKLHNA